MKSIKAKHFLLLILICLVSFSNQTRLKEKRTFKQASVLEGHKSIKNLISLENNLIGYIYRNSIVIKDIITSKIRKIEIDEEYYINDLCYIGNSQLAVTISKYSVSRIRIWDVNTLDLNEKNLFHYETLSSLAYLGNDLFAVVSLNKILIWNRFSNEITKRIETDLETKTILSLGNDLFGTLYEKSNYIQVYNSKSGQIIKTISIQEEIISMCLVGNSEIAVFSKENIYRIDYMTEKKEKIYTSTLINYLVYIGNDQLALIRSHQFIIIINSKTGEFIKTFQEKKSFFYYYSSLIFIGNTHLVTFNSEHNLTVWDLSNKKIIKSLNGHTKNITSIVDLGNDLLVSKSKDELIVWNYKSESILKKIDVGFAINPKIYYINNELIAFQRDFYVDIWNVQTEKKVVELVGNINSDIVSLSYIGNEELAVAYGKGVMLFNIISGETIKTISINHDVINMLYLENSTVLLITEDKVFILDLKTRKNLHVIENLNTNQACYLGNGVVLLTNDYNHKRFYVFNMNVGEIVKTVEDEDIHYILKLNEREFVTFGKSQFIKVWDSSRYEEVYRYNRPHDGIVLSYSSIGFNKIAIADSNYKLSVLEFS